MMTSQNSFAKTVIPICLVMVAVLLSVLKIPLPVIDFVRPNLLLMLVYFWAIHDPRFLSYPLIFCAGLALDLLIGTHIGMTAILMIGLFLVVKGQRRYLIGQTLWVQWLCFVLVVLIYSITEWAVIMLLSFVFFMPTKTAIVALLSLCLYPFFALFLKKIHRYTGTR